MIRGPLSDADRAAFRTAPAERTTGVRLRASVATWQGKATIASDFWITGTHLPRPVVGTLLAAIPRDDGGAMVELEVTPDDAAFLSEHILGQADG